MHSDVGAAIARLDHEARSGEAEADTPAPAPVPEASDEVADDAEPAGDADADDAERTDADGATPAAEDRPEPESDLERTTRQVTGGLAESLRETAGVSGPVGALFGLSDADQSGADAADDAAAPAATPAEPETIDLRERPEAVQSLADSDDPLADLVKQAVGKAVERAAEDTAESE